MKHNKLFQILTALLLFFMYSGYTQVKIGAKIGYSLGKLATSTENIYTDEFSTTRGMDWGMLVEIPINEMVSIQPEFNFTQRGGLRDGSQPVQTEPLAEAFEEVGFSLSQLNQLIFFSGGQPITNENPFYADYYSDSELRYLEIPVLVKLGWGSNWRFYVEAGPSMAVLLSANQITTGQSQLYYDREMSDPLKIPNAEFPDGPPFLDIDAPPIPFDAETDINNDIESMSVGVQAGLGLIKNFGRSEVFLDAKFSYGLSSIQRDSTFGESTIGGVIFSIGYSYTLGDAL
jgi:hypothetical protein